MAKLRVKWTATKVAETKQRLSEEIFATKISNPTSPANSVINKICTPDSKSSQDEILLLEFLRGIFLLNEFSSPNYCLVSKERLEEDLKNITGECQRLLTLAGVDPNRSALSFMYRDLYLAKANVALKLGSSTEAA